MTQGLTSAHQQIDRSWAIHPRTKVWSEHGQGLTGTLQAKGAPALMLIIGEDDFMVL